ncbi:unnamed protein product [Chironomus riparius]|uniref:C2H2-type domain-containing protein n=1 Tax=Chironomus riparius TaxID=315576 RepID=A0A9N9WZ12_9DIPT|nr:unnamed protein product [Chironomus riparius]
MSSKDLKLKPTKMRIELNEDDFEMQPDAKRAKIEIEAILKIKEQNTPQLVNDELKINISEPRRLRSGRIIEFSQKSATTKAKNASNSNKISKPTISQKVDSTRQDSVQLKPELINIEPRTNNVIQESTQINQESISSNQLQNQVNHSLRTTEIIDIKPNIPQKDQATIRVKDEPQNVEIINISSEAIKTEELLTDETFDTSCDIIELKPTKKEDPDSPFGMLPIRDIDELFIDLPGSLFNQLNEQLDDEQIIVIDDEVNDDKDCIKLLKCKKIKLKVTSNNDSKLNILKPTKMKIEDNKNGIKTLKSLKTLQCDLCPKLFKSAIDLKNHKVIHKFNCQQCRKTFRLERQMIKHVRNFHQTAKIFQCNICFKKFIRQFCLDTHMRNIHEPNRPKTNKCQICGFECDSSKRFKKHIKTHMDEDVKVKIEKEIRTEMEIKAEMKIKAVKKIKAEKKPKSEMKIQNHLKAKKKFKVEVKEEKKVFEFKAVKN